MDKEEKTRKNYPWKINFVQETLFQKKTFENVDFVDFLYFLWKKMKRKFSSWNEFEEINFVKQIADENKERGVNEDFELL
jgi:hypothetical protein